MTEEDYKAVISAYQQGAFELFNQNIIFETQINNLKSLLNLSNKQLEKFKIQKNQQKVQQVVLNKEILK
jgi:hypothetical protein